MDKRQRHHCSIADIRKKLVLIACPACYIAGRGNFIEVEEFDHVMKVIGNLAFHAHRNSLTIPSDFNGRRISALDEENLQPKSKRTALESPKRSARPMGPCGAAMAVGCADAAEKERVAAKAKMAVAEELYDAEEECSRLRAPVRHLQDDLKASYAEGGDDYQELEPKEGKVREEVSDLRQRVLCTLTSTTRNRVLWAWG